MGNHTAIPQLLILPLLILLFNSCSSNEQDKHPDISYFPDFNTTSKNIHLQPFSEDQENIKRVYVSRDKKKLLVLAQLTNDSNENYRLKVYDQNLNLLKKIDAPELNGLFGLDDMGDLYAGKGYFQHDTFQYRPIQQLWATDDPKHFIPPNKDVRTLDAKPLIMDLKTLSDFPKRGDTLLSFQRKDYKEGYYYLKKSSRVYQILFKDCAYCEGRFNAEKSISEYRAEENGVRDVLRPFDRVEGALFPSKPLLYYRIKFGNDTVHFKVRYADNIRVNQIKTIYFAEKTFILNHTADGKNSQLYFFKVN